MNTLRILYLEDSSQDAEMTARTLKKAGIPFTFNLVDNQDEYEAALKEYSPDLILADHSLFHFNSMEALRIFKSFDFRIPFILVTGTVSEEFAVNILKQGATDYLLKDNLARLPNAVLNALEKFRMERERQQYLEDILSNERMLKQAEQLAQFGSWQLDLPTGKMVWSDETFRIYGYEPGTIKPGYDLFLIHVHHDDYVFFKDCFETLLRHKDSRKFEFRITDSNEKLKHIQARIMIECNNEGQSTRYVGFMQDITERKVAEEKLLTSVQDLARLEKELIEHQLGHQKLITEITIQAQEKERNELAKELHDNINQVLASVKMYLNIAKDDESMRQDLVNRSYENVNYAIEEIRKLSRSLVAPSLGDMGILEALLELAEEVNLTGGVRIHLDYHNNTQTKLDSNIELMLYRIAQEQVNNITKYANAGTANIELEIGPGIIRLTIADDGVGFDPAEKAKGIGLKNISSRVSFYDGTLDIIAAPGQGCRLEIRIPI